MGAGATGASGREAATGGGSMAGAIGFAMSLVGWVVLAVSLFIERATSPFPGVTVVSLIETWPYGIPLVFLLALILPATLFARRLSGNFVWLLAGLWLCASAITIYAGFNLESASTASVGTGTYAVVGTGINNEASLGTILSIIGANLGFVGTGLMAWSRRDI